MIFFEEILIFNLTLLSQSIKDKTLLEIVFPIANDAVAAGDGALQTCIIFPSCRISKSSNKLP